MTDRRMDDWEVIDFAMNFRKAAEGSSDESFKGAFGALADALGPLDAEFFRETSGCGNQLAMVLEELRSISGRMGYCQRNRGLEEDCQGLYGEVFGTVETVESLDKACFL